MNPHEQNVQRLVQSIRARGSAADLIAQRLRTPEILAAFNKWDDKSWCISVAGDSLVRVRLFTEQNFQFVETIGVVAVARYVFELSVWLRLFRLDRRYGLIYFDQLIETQQRYYQDMKGQLEREIALLKSFEERENALQGQAVQDIKASGMGDAGPSTVVLTLKKISEAMDAEAARRFSIYATAARTSGYGFQAHLVETKALPPILQALADIAAERDRFEATVSEDIKALIPARWQWRSMAQKVGTTDQYDYIYSFASKLLHATPASITTDRKNLEIEEVEVFLKYIDVTIADILTLAEEYCRSDGAV